MKDPPDERPPWWKTPLMRDPPDERSPWWKTPLMKDPPDERPTWWEITLMRDPPDERSPWWKTPPPPRWKIPLMKDPPDERSPWWKTPPDERSPWWKTPLMRDHPDERPAPPPTPHPRWKIPLMKDPPDERPPWWETPLMKDPPPPMKDHPDESSPWCDTTSLLRPLAEAPRRPLFPKSSLHVNDPLTRTTLFQATFTSMQAGLKRALPLHNELFKLLKELYEVSGVQGQVHAFCHRSSPSWSACVSGFCILYISLLQRGKSSRKTMGTFFLAKLLPVVLHAKTVSFSLGKATASCATCQNGELFSWQSYCQLCYMLKRWAFLLAKLLSAVLHAKTVSFSLGKATASCATC